MSSIIIHKLLMVIILWRWSDSHIRHSTNHCSWSSTKRREVTNIWHPMYICIWRKAHRLVMSHLRRRLLQEVRVIHATTRQHLMPFVRTKITHLLIDVHPLHLLLKVIASIFSLVSKQTCYISAHIKKRGALVRYAVVHVMIC